jgi:hypothetical protein
LVVTSAYSPSGYFGFWQAGVKEKARSVKAVTASLPVFVDVILFLLEIAIIVSSEL